MATYRYVDLHLAEARLLADLTGIRADLETARAYAQRLSALLRSERADWSLVEPLSVALSVAYSRAFTTGVRTRLDDSDLVGLTPAQLEIHSHLRAYRDKHVAHSVNAFEHNQPRAHYWAERVETEGIVAVGCSHARVASLSSAVVEGVDELITAVAAHIDARIANEQKALLAVVRALPLAEVLAGGQGAFRLEQGTRVDRARAK